jgi:DHA1 family tetracycline resistance protein-like MFS transporter
MSEIAPDPAVRRSAAALPTLLSVMLINMLGFGVVVPLLPFYAKSFSAPPWQIALLFSAYAIGSFFGEPFWGRLSDRIGRKPLLISTVSANCLCYLALAFAPNIYVAFLVRLAGGMAAGNSSVVQGYIADVTPAGQRAGRMSLLGAAYNVGFIFGPALGGLLARTGNGPAGFQLPLLVASGLAAVSATCIFLFVAESRVATRHVLTQASPWTMIGQAVDNPVVRRLMILTLFTGLAFNGIEATFGFWSQHRYGWGTRDIGLAFTVSAVVSATAQTFLTGQLSRRFGQARMLASGMVITVICTALQPLSPNGFMTVVLMAIASLGGSVAFPNSSALISQSSHPDHQGQMLGLNNAAGALARVIGPVIALSLFTYVSFDSPFILGAAIVAPAVFLALSAGRAAMRVSPQGV